MLASNLLQAQKSVILADMEFRIRNSSSEVIWFGLEKGDRIEFEVNVYDSATLRSVAFSEYEAGDIFKEINPTHISKKNIDIVHRGIYYFTLTQAGFLAGKRFGNIKVYRYPASEASQNFNTTVYWKTVTDTVWYNETEIILDHIDTISESIVMQHIVLGKRNKDNRAVINFSIPDSTQHWSWFIVAGSDGDMTYNGLNESMSETNAIVRNQGLMTYIALGGKIGYTLKPGSSYVNAGFTDSTSIADKFLLSGYVSDSIMKKAAVYTGSQSDTIYKPMSILLLNNTRKKSFVFVYITAVKTKDIFISKTVEKFRIEETQVPYLQQ
jgi:hypothetical protein